MYTVLRGVIAAGLCARSLKAESGHVLGDLHALLDQKIVDGLAQFEGNDSLIFQASGPIPNLRLREHFQNTLRSLVEKREIFEKCEIRMMHDGAFRYMHLKDDDTWVEPVYSFYEPQTFIPMYSLCAAFLAGFEGKDIKVRVISASGDLDEVKRYHYDMKAMDAVLLAAQSEAINVGPYCYTCPKTECSFTKKFEQEYHDWMKAKQKADEMEGRVREHLTWMGPTQVGAYLAHMKETGRKTTDRKRFAEIQKALIECDPKGYMKYFNISASTIVKDIAAGKLPKTMEQFIKASKSFSIDTIFNPE